MKVRKGVFGAVLILCATLCMTNVTALADDGTHTHPICGTTHTDIGDHTGECADVVWTAWDGTSDIDYGDDNTAYVYLSGNSERSEQFAVKDGKTLYLCLNGYSITRTTDSTDAFDSVIRVYGDAQLVLCDCKVSGTITHSADVYGRGVRLGDSSSTGDFIMYGGEISGNRIDISAHSAAAGDGAGVESQLSDFTMYGGKITNNHVINGSNNEGGGVNMHTGGTFTMYGGEISGNACSDTGGGVISAGAYLKLYGGTISNNTADKRGGGVFTNMTLTISDGITITGNKSEQGGGIYTYDEDITINGGNITGNTATYGGGVYHIGDYRTCDTLTISGSATITGNTATDGGGVYVESGKTPQIGTKAKVHSKSMAAASQTIPQPAMAVVFTSMNADYSLLRAATSQTTPRQLTAAVYILTVKAKNSIFPVISTSPGSKRVAKQTISICLTDRSLKLWVN